MSESKTKIKVLTAAQYLDKVPREKDHSHLAATRMDAAIALLYAENKVIDKYERKGEIKFVVEA